MTREAAAPRTANEGEVVKMAGTPRGEWRDPTPHQMTRRRAGQAPGHPTAPRPPKIRHLRSGSTAVPGRRIPRHPLGALAARLLHVWVTTVLPPLRPRCEPQSRRTRIGYRH